MSHLAQPRVVSVVVATRDRPQLLSDALASIRALEGPDLVFQILVGDNGDLPETRKVAEAFGAVHATTSANGCAAARNAAARHATGEFIAYLDDDDVWKPGHIRPHIAMMDADPDLETVFGQVVVCDEALTPLSDPTPADLPRDGDVFMSMIGGYFPQVGANLARARTLQTIGLMDETLFGDSDWDWNLRIARRHKVGFVAIPCVSCRSRPPNSFDALQRLRVGYTRKVFLRHALPEWRRWTSPLALLRSYFSSVESYHRYFCEAALMRDQKRDGPGVRRAVLDALTILPLRTVKSLIRPTPLRRAFLASFGSGAASSMPRQPLLSSTAARTE